MPGPHRPLSAEDVRTAVVRTLHEIAPEADLAEVADTANLRRELDLDSVDVQNFVIGLAKELQVDIAERDAARLATLAGCHDYLRERGLTVDGKP